MGGQESGQLESSHREVEWLERQIMMSEQLDDAIEAALRHHSPLESVMPGLIEIGQRHIEAQLLYARCQDEEGHMHHWSSASGRGEPQERLEELCAQVEITGAQVRQSDDELLIAGRFDLEDQPLGSAVASFALPVNEESKHRRLVEAWIEQVDNLIAVIQQGRRRKRLFRRLHDATTAPSLEQGINDALQMLSSAIGFGDLLLVARPEDPSRGIASIYRIIVNGNRLYDSSAPTTQGFEGIVSETVTMLFDEALEDEWMHQLSIEPTYVLDLPIRQGGEESVVLGRLIVGTDDAPLRPLERDLLEHFSSLLQARLVEPDRRDWDLAHHFTARVVRELSGEDLAQALPPRRDPAAWMICSMAGFPFLGQPEEDTHELMELLRRWGQRVKQILWETDGVFVQMLGERVLALWGPPRFEAQGQWSCQQAVSAGRRIAAMTLKLSVECQSSQEGLSQIVVPFASRVALHYGDTVAGHFGHGDGYLALGPGLEEVLQLHLHAGYDDLLCTQGFVEALGDMDAFGHPRELKPGDHREEPVTIYPLLRPAPRTQ